MADGELSYEDVWGTPAAQPAQQPAAQAVPSDVSGWLKNEGTPYESATSPSTHTVWLRPSGKEGPIVPRESVYPTPTSEKTEPPSSTAAASSPQKGELSYEDVWGAPASPKRTGPVANLGAGTNERTMEMLGAPVDIATGALNLIPRGLNALTGSDIPTIDHPVGGSDWLKDRESQLGIDPRDIAPANGGERALRAAGAGAASMVLPGGVAKALPELGGMAGALQDSFGAGSTTGQAFTGAAAGAGGQKAEDAAPEWAKPLANLAGQIGAGGAAGATEAGVKAVWDGLSSAASRMWGPLSSTGRTNLAAERLQGAATNPAQAADDIGTNQHELVPGSQGTTFQVSGDQGLGNLERASAAQRPDMFLSRAAEQNQARVGALQSPRIAPQAANPQNVMTTVRAAMDRMDAANATREALALRQYEAAQGAQAVPQTAALTAAQRETSLLGGHVPAGADQQQTALQGYGAAMRQPLVAANAAAKEEESNLWNAIDPDGTLAVNMTPVRQAAKQMAASQPANAAPLTGEPGLIFAQAASLPDVQPFAELGALRGRITDAMRAEMMANGKTQTYGRLSQLLDSVHDAMEPALQEKATQEAQAVASGAMSPDATMMARLHAEAQDFLSRRSETNASTGTRSGPDIGGAGGLGPNAVRGGTGAAGQAGRRPGSAARATGLQGEPPLTPNWNAAASERYGAARNATRQRHETFTNAPGVGQVVEPGRTSDSFALHASQVPATLFSGKGAAERIQAYLKAGGPRQALIDYAAFDLRRAAENPDGTLDPAKAQRWLAGHNEAATVLPELRQMGSNAVAARQAFDAATERAEATRDTAEDAAKGVYREAQQKRVADQRAFQQSAAGRFLGDADPVASVGRILKSDTAVADMRRMAAMTAGSTSARMGLRRAVAEYIMREMKGNTLAGNTGETTLKSDAFQTFIRKSSPALEQIFPPEQMASLRAIAADLQRASKSVSGTKLPGGSNTTQDMMALAKSSVKDRSVLGQMIASEAIGLSLGAPGIGGATAFGSLVLSVMRKAGYQKVDDLVADAMLNPDLAKTLLLRPLATGETRVLNILQQRLRAVAMAGAATSDRDEQPALRTGTRN